MPIHLDKILADIAKEKVLHPYYTDATKQDIDDAWARVGKINKLSVHESRSIFKVLQKKYDQEKLKEHSSWKLFSIMDEIHKKEESKPEIKDEDSSGMPMEEEEEYEMLDVHEDDDAMHNSFPSDDEEPQRSNNSSMNSPENENVKEKSGGKQSQQQPTQQSKVPPSTPKTSHSTEEKKVLNAALGTPRPAAGAAATTPNTQTTAATAAALQKKGITLKKTSAAGSSAAAGTATGTASAVTPGNLQKVVKAAAARSHNTHSQDNCKTIQLPESIKRKLSDESSSSPSQVKKMHIGQTTATAVARQVSTIVSPQGRGAPQAQETQHTTTAQLMQVKQDREDQLAAAAGAAQSEQSSQQPQSGGSGINIITIPANPTRIELTNGNTGGGGACSSTAATVASTSTNGFSPPRIEDLDFKHDIIFDTGSALNGATAATNNGMAKLASQAGEIINLGNFDNSLPPTFFKNLCNSSRHEALGLYVANIMNRLPVRAAAKLELGILRAIIDVQSDELES